MQKSVPDKQIFAILAEISCSSYTNDIKLINKPDFGATYPSLNELKTRFTFRNRIPCKKTAQWLKRQNTQFITTTLVTHTTLHNTHI